MHRWKSRIKKKLALRRKVHNAKPVSDSCHSFFGDDILQILASFGKENFLFSAGKQWPPSEPGFLDLYSGKKGFARAAVKLGAPWVLTVDILDGAQADLLSSEVRKKIWILLKAKVFIHLSAAPICSSFSTAIIPPVRSRAEPRSMREKILEGNSHSKFVAALIAFCIMNSIAYWAENPDSSFMWKQPEWLRLPRKMHLKFFRVDFCRHGTPWRKRTRFITSGRLGNVRELCTRDHVHTILRGRSSKHRMSMTKLAEPYPFSLCKQLAWSACADLNLLKLGSTDACFCQHKRIGEAANPGPRRSVTKSPNVTELDDVRLIRPETEALGLKAWTEFLQWVNVVLGADVLATLWLVPGLGGHARTLW